MPAPKKANKPNLEGYVEVADRIKLFYERYPEGSLQAAVPPVVMEVEGKSYLVYSALAFRSPDDQRPGQGTAWEPLPGKTPYTRDSEMMNAETSAWGRAIASLGIGLTAEGKIASREEVRNRTAHATDTETPEPSRPDVAISAEAYKACLNAVRELAKSASSTEEKDELKAGLVTWMEAEFKPDKPLSSTSSIPNLIGSTLRNDDDALNFISHVQTMIQDVS